MLARFGAKADAKDNGHDVVGDGSDFVGYQPTWVNEECYEELLGEDVERANCQRKKKGKQIAEEVESVEEIVESDYDQDLEDITSDTCVDPNKDWDSLEFPDVPRVECGSGSDIDDGSDDLNSLDGSDCEDDEGRHPRKFLNTRQAIRAHAITNRREVKFQKNDANREYGAKLRRLNPGSSVIMKCSEGVAGENPRFQRLYICMAALKEG
ncbi:hypothetical protein Q3G72_000375 [Acer saccharum]|nr:hypothetical protein Q3G72_000375 [Acer saccharum]